MLAIEPVVMCGVVGTTNELKQPCCWDEVWVRAAVGMLLQDRVHSHL